MAVDGSAVAANITENTYLNIVRDIRFDDVAAVVKRLHQVETPHKVHRVNSLGGRASVPGQVDKLLDSTYNGNLREMHPRARALEGVSTA